MTDQTPDLDYVDYTRIPFPSDHLTFGAVRRAHPDLFDVDGTELFFDTATTATDVPDLFYLERLLARQAFEAALGRPGELLRSRNLEREDCLQELTAGYVRYGLSTGRHHTEQLVREFEALAAAQAPGRSGPS